MVIDQDRLGTRPVKLAVGQDRLGTGPVKLAVGQERLETGVQLVIDQGLEDWTTLWQFVC